MKLTGLLTHLHGLPDVQRLAAHISDPSATVTIGVNDAAKAAVIAALGRMERGPVLVITARPARAHSLAEEISAWLGDGAAVMDFPERDPLPFERLRPDGEAVAARLAVLSALADSRARIVVASALAIAQRTLSPTELRGSQVRLKTGDGLILDDLIRRLDRLGYCVEPVVDGPGQAARRGGIVDIFPRGAEQPVRVEFWGDEVESIRIFDPDTQRTLSTIETAIVIGPAREAILSADSPGLDLIMKLDTRGLAPPERDRFEEEFSLLKSGGALLDPDFYVPFLATSTLLDHLPPGALLIVDEADDTSAALGEAEAEAAASKQELEARLQLPKGFPNALESAGTLRDRIEDAPRALRLARWAIEADGIVRLPFAGAPSYAGQLRRLVNETAARVESGERVVIVTQQAERLAELFGEHGRPVAAMSDVTENPPLLCLVHGALPEGWAQTSDPAITLLTDSEVFGFTKQRRAAPRKAVNRDAFLAELTPGSYVVHIDHGIARFAGTVHRTVDGVEREYIELQYAEGDRLFVPTDQLDRVSRYIGPSDRTPSPTRLASGEWQRAKQRARRAVQELAKELLTLYAAREALPGYGYSPDTAWQAELEASFPYVETADQMSAILAVKRDMEAPRPMDRLVCGDVGYGKTEVAIRAAFKAVMDGRQVAVLVPTTVLAQQHYDTFRERLAAFPARIDVLSRFRSDAEQKQIVESLAEGSVDIVIGTHRLLQKDVRFKDLGLLVIDEEQRFGVAHKEFLKRMRREVDVLTLSATPIPRTLYMAMGGIRDMSTMETPPEQRLPIKTYVSEYDERIVHEAITRELERGGQVYFVHNRVHNIAMIAGKVRDAVPAARIAIGHGQMDERELAKAMDDFVHGRLDVLVCTTIIESGLDIPNVNTIIINQADRLGLAQLYQLRGRVGRGMNRAYAYLLYDRARRLTDTARQRLQTIFEATELGAGFQIALRDLEIRGAGNLLGSEQSGYMAAIGFDLYVRLLSGAVERFRAMMRGETPQPEREGPEISIDLPISAHLPSSYIPDINLRLAVYQRLSAAADASAVVAIGDEMTDRFGPPPPAAKSLLYAIAVRTIARNAGVRSIAAEGNVAVIRMREGEELEAESLSDTVPRGVQVTRHTARVSLEEGWRERLLDTVGQILAAKSSVAPAQP